MSKAIYKLSFDCGRMGSVDGVFLAEKAEIELLFNEKPTIYFGEILGKHSEVEWIPDPEELKMISDSPEVVKLFEDHDLSSGYNPLEYFEESDEEE